MIETLYTIGGYGYDEEGFFSALLENQIDCLCDIRQRRGMRGSKYSFLNSIQLQRRLLFFNIAYVHIKELAPTSAVRSLQRHEDSAQRTSKQQRTELAPSFIDAFIHEVLAVQTPKSLLERIPASAMRPSFFCVERTPSACHRSLVATWMHKSLGLPVVHIGEVCEHSHRG